MDNTNIKPSGQAGAKKNKMVISNLSDKQKEALKAGGFAAAGIVIGAGLFALYSMNDPMADPIVEPPAPTPGSPTHPTEPVVIYTDAPMAESVTDEMSFAQGFAAAREEVGGGGFFEWRGNVYNTYYKEEWERLSPEEQHQYMASLDVHNDAIEDVTPVDDNQNLTVTDDPNHTDNNVVVNDDIKPDVTPVIEQENLANAGNAIQIDFNKDDGIIDGIAIDPNKDGLADVIGIDRDRNGLIDTYIIDGDDEPGLDTVIIDADEDFVLTGTEQTFSLDEQLVFEIPADDQTPDNSPDIILASNTMEDPMPDMDNTADVSDFDIITQA